MIDDASTDDSFNVIKKKFSRVRMYRNEKNLGYSKTYNRGTKHARGRYILHLNSDVTFTRESHLDLLVKFMDTHKNVGVVGCKVLKHDGSLDLPCRHAIPTLANVLFQMFGLFRIFPQWKTTNYYMTYLDVNQSTEVGGILGAFMFIRRSVIKKIGYLDEKFYMYCEDTDFCYRTIKAGWKVFYYPKVAIRHIHGGTSQQFRFRAVILFHLGMLHYYNKHHKRKSSVGLNTCVYLGLLIRFLLYMTIEIITHVVVYLQTAMISIAERGRNVRI